MNDEQLDKKVRQDAAKVKKDLQTLLEHSAARLGRFENQVSKTTGETKQDLTAWVEENLAQLSKTIDSLTGTAQDSLEDTAATVKKQVKLGLNRSNAVAKEFINNLPDGLVKKPARYPWAAISIVLVVGLLLGFFIKPTPQPVE